jgi:hypothetical protein
MIVDRGTPVSQKILCFRTPWSSRARTLDRIGVPQWPLGGLHGGVEVIEVVMFDDREAWRISGGSVSFVAKLVHTYGQGLGLAPDHWVGTEIQYPTDSPMPSLTCPPSSLSPCNKNKTEPVPRSGLSAMKDGMMSEWIDGGEVHNNHQDRVMHMIQLLL